MPRVVIAFDGSPSARAALDLAGVLFPEAPTLVVSVAALAGAVRDSSSAARIALPDHVIHTALERLRDSALEEARELADEGARLGRAAGLNATPRAVVAETSVGSAVVEAAKEANGEVLVCGARGQGTITRAVLGSVSSKLVAHSDMPVLVVPGAPAAPATGPAVIGFDGSEAAAGAVERCSQILPGRESLVLNVWRSPIRHNVTGKLLQRPLAELDQEFVVSAEAQADRGAALARERGLDARGRATESRDSIAEVIMDVADEEDAVVIVVGRRGLGTVATAVLGSVSSAVTHASRRPVLVVP